MLCLRGGKVYSCPMRVFLSCSKTQPIRIHKTAKRLNSEPQSYWSKSFNCTWSPFIIENYKEWFFFNVHKNAQTLENKSRMPRMALVRRKM